MSNANNQKREFFIEDLGGIIQRQDPDKIPPNRSPLLINISLDRPGTWTKRKGSSLLDATQAGNGVYGLIEYRPKSGSRALRAVRSTDLDTFNGTIWSQAAAAGFTASTKIESINYLDRVYHASTADYLSYESGGALTVVSSGDNRVKAAGLTVAQNTLFACGVTTAGGISGADRVYYSEFDLTNNTPTHVFWNASAGETSMATSTRWFTLLGEFRACFTYSQTGLAYFWTVDKGFGFDLKFAENDTGVQQVFNTGCAGPRAVTECNGWLIWMDPSARIWIWGGSGAPVNISWDIEDDTFGEAIINKIDKTNIQNVAAGSIGNKFRFSIGDITVFGRTITNAVLTGLISQNGSGVMWSIESYPQRPNIFATARLSNQEVMVYGAAGVDDVYKMDTGTNDGSTAISASALTYFGRYGDSPFKTRNGDMLAVKYRPQGADNTYLGVKFSVDGSLVYTPVSTPDEAGASQVTNHGVIDMYNSDSSNLLEDVGYIMLPSDVRFRNLSIEFYNNKSSETFALQSYSIIRGTEEQLDMKLKST